MADLDQILELQKDARQRLEKYFPKIKFPKVVELMEELNKQNRAEYERWLYLKKATDKLLGKKTFPEAYAI